MLYRDLISHLQHNSNQNNNNNNIIMYRFFRETYNMRFGTA